MNRVIHPRLAVHAHHAQVQRMRSREDAQPQQRERHRRLRALGQRAHLLHGSGLGDSVPGQNHRTLRVSYQFRSFVQSLFIHMQHGMRSVGARLGRGKVEDRRCLLRVLGDVDEHRPRPPAARNLKRVPDGRRNVFRAVDEEVMLGYRQRDARDVHFLESIGAQHLARHVARDTDNRNRVQHRGGNARHKVCRARSAGCNGHAHFA